MARKTNRKMLRTGVEFNKAPAERKTTFPNYLSNHTELAKSEDDTGVAGALLKRNEDPLNNNKTDFKSKLPMPGKQDPFTLTLYERTKTEENYFDGTGGRASKLKYKSRKEMPLFVSPEQAAAVDSTYTMQPSVPNRWMQKRGNELFTKKEETEDDMMRAIKNSLASFACESQRQINSDYTKESQILNSHVAGESHRSRTDDRGPFARESHRSQTDDRGPFARESHRSQTDDRGPFARESHRSQTDDRGLFARESHRSRTDDRGPFARESHRSRTDDRGPFARESHRTRTDDRNSSAKESLRSQTNDREFQKQSDDQSVDDDTWNYTRGPHVSNNRRVNKTASEFYNCDASTERSDVKSSARQAEESRTGVRKEVDSCDDGPRRRKPESKERQERNYQQIVALVRSTVMTNLAESNTKKPVTTGTPQIAPQISEQSRIQSAVKDEAEEEEETEGAIEMEPAEDNCDAFNNSDIPKMSAAEEALAAVENATAPQEPKIETTVLPNVQEILHNMADMGYGPPIPGYLQPTFNPQLDAGRNPCAMIPPYSLPGFPALPMMPNYFPVGLPGWWNSSQMQAPPFSPLQLPLSQVLPAQPQMSQIPLAQPQMSQVPMAQPQMSQVPMAQPQMSQVPMAQPQMSQVPKAQPQMSQVPKAQPQMSQARASAACVPDTTSVRWPYFPEAPTNEQLIQSLKLLHLLSMQQSGAIVPTSK